MEKVRSLLIAVLIVFSLSSYAQAGVIGIPDHVPAATLIVPFFEVGIDAGAYPQDTLPVVKNTSSSVVTVHYHVWDVNGNAISDLNGNLTLNPAASMPFSMRATISGASAASKSQLTDGAFYRGFMTFDVVTASTSLNPKAAGYPFSSANVLEGWIYFTRLNEGSSNGLSMVPIEASSLSSMTGFYQSSDNRERIDADARYSATKLTTLPDPNNAIDRVDARVYLEPANNATSRFIVFTFPKGGSCVYCGPGVVGYLRYDGNGNAVENTTANFNRVVNVINVSGTQSGDVSLWNIPGGWETYAFSTNSASPGFNPALTWDAIFEAFVNTQIAQDVTSITPPAQNIAGTYSLKAFTVKYSNGLTITEQDVSVSGTMKVGPSTISQSLLINNNPITLSGTYSITYTSGTTAGILHIVDPSGTHNLSFSISGNDLTTYSGILPLNSTTTFEEWDTWTKTSDSVQSTSIHTTENASSESAFKFIGELISEKSLIAIP